MWREERGDGFPPRLHGGRLYAGKRLGARMVWRAVPEPPLRIATNLGLSGIVAVYFHSNDRGLELRGGRVGEGSRRRKTLYGFPPVAGTVEADNSQKPPVSRVKPVVLQVASVEAPVSQRYGVTVSEHLLHALAYGHRFHIEQQRIEG